MMRCALGLDGQLVVISIPKAEEALVFVNPGKKSAICGAGMERLNRQIVLLGNGHVTRGASDATPVFNLGDGQLMAASGCSLETVRGRARRNKR